MKPSIFLFTLLLIFSINLGAQNRISVGGGYDIAFPLGDFDDIASTGYNWTLFAEYPVSNKVSLQLLAGIMGYTIDLPPIAIQGNVVTFDLKAIPIKAAVKYYIIEELFIQAEAGVNFIKVSAEFQGAYGDPTNESTDYQAKFTIGGGPGYEFFLSEQSSLNVTAKYIYVNGGDLSIDFNHILLGVGLLIHFKI